MIEYDPYSDAAMADPWDLYARLRAESPVHYIEKYDTWALSCFEEVWQATLNHEVYTATQGVSPGQILLGEPFPNTFMTMDMPDHKRHRGIIARAYAKSSVASYSERIRALADEILEPLVEAGGCDLYADYANRVATIFTGEMVGLGRDVVEPLREKIDHFFHREPGQIGTSAENARYGEEIGGTLAGIVAERRQAAARPADHISAWIDAEIGGTRLSDEEIVANIYSILVTGSETVPLAAAGTAYYLAEQPALLGRALDDPSLVAHACAEAIRVDQPTNILGRRVTGDVELRGQKLRAGQGVLFLYCSANRDEAEFENAEGFDLDRRPKRSLSFGHGIHKCLGEHLGFLETSILVETLLARVGEIQIDPTSCKRVYGEFLSGFSSVPARWKS